MSITIKSTDLARLLSVTDEEKQKGIYLDFGNGKKEFKCWWTNGQLWEHRFYENDKRHGECKNWHRNGRLFIHCFYENDKMIKDYLE